MRRDLPTLDPPYLYGRLHLHRRRHLCLGLFETWGGGHHIWFIIILILALTPPGSVPFDNGNKAKNKAFPLLLRYFNFIESLPEVKLMAMRRPRRDLTLFISHLYIILIFRYSSLLRSISICIMLHNEIILCISWW